MTLGARRNKKKFEDLPPHVQKGGLNTVRFLAIFGWLLLLGYGFYVWDDARWMRESIANTAEVISVDEHVSTDSDGHTSYAYSPTFLFETEEGEVYTVTPDYSYSEWGFAPGKQITIRYRPSTPERAVPYGYTDEVFGVPTLALVALSIGIFSALLGTLGWWDLSRRLKGEEKGSDPIDGEEKGSDPIDDDSSSR